MPLLILLIKKAFIVNDMLISYVGSYCPFFSDKNEMLRFERLLTAVVPRLKKWQATTVLPRNSTVQLSTNVGAARQDLRTK